MVECRDVSEKRLSCRVVVWGDVLCRAVPEKRLSCRVGLWCGVVWCAVMCCDGKAVGVSGRVGL